MHEAVLSFWFETLSPAHPAREKIRPDAAPAAFICVGQTCSLPVSKPNEIASVFAAAHRPV